jgi:hypothetical protein
MATPYKVLFDGVLSKLKSTGLPELSELDTDEIIFDYIRPACIRFKACKQDLSMRDDLRWRFDIDLTEEEIEILVCFMLIEYLSSNYINVPSLLRQTLTSRDFHVFSNRNHLDGLVNLRAVYSREARQMVSAYSNHDSDLFSKLKNENRR